MTNLLRQKGPFTEDQARIYIAEVVLAIEHLHKVGTLLHYGPFFANKLHKIV